MNNSGQQLSLTVLPQTETAGYAQACQEVMQRLLYALINESSDQRQLILTTVNDQFKVRRIVLPSNAGVLSCIEANDRNITVYLSVVLLRNDGGLTELDVMTLLSCILDSWKTEDVCSEKIKAEINNCLDHLAMAFDHEAEHTDQVSHYIKAAILAKQSVFQQRETLLNSEIIPFKGHPIHVCAKTKMGFSRQDVMAYSPEFSPKVNLQLLAVHRSQLVYSDEIDIWTKYSAELLSYKQAEDYLIMPVHPWQYENVISKAYKAHIDSGILFKLEDEAMEVLPTLSMRTALLPATLNQPFYHIKVPVNIQATSVKRSLTLRDLYNGIEFSKLISDMVQKIPSMANKRGRMISDVCAAHFKIQGETNPGLSFLLRNDPINYCLPGETMVVAAALTHSTKLHPYPLLCQFIDQSKLPVETYLDQLIETLLAMPLEVFLHEGIALDLHGQNTMIVFDESHQVCALAYRDLGSVQVADTYQSLNEQKHLFYGEASTFMNYRDTVSELMHTLFNNLIGGIISCTASAYSIPEQQIWRKVKETSMRIIQSCKVPDQVKNDFCKMLFSPDLMIKPLLKMRIAEKTLYQAIPNPMFNIS